MIGDIEHLKVLYITRGSVISFCLEIATLFLERNYFAFNWGLYRACGPIPLVILGLRPQYNTT